MRRKAPLFCALLLLFAFQGARGADAITLGQSDDFESGPQGWGDGLGPGTLDTPGPTGANDSFLRISTEVRPRLVNLNSAQWSGDYLAAGVRAITLSAINLGSSTIELRAAIGDVGLGPNTGGTWFSSTDAITLAPGGGWQQVTLSLDATRLTRVAGGDSAADVLAGVSALRLLHATIPDARGQSIASALGIDQVTAVPEPGSGSLCLLGLALGSRSRRRYRTRRMHRN